MKWKLVTYEKQCFHPNCYIPFLSFHKTLLSLVQMLFHNHHKKELLFSSWRQLYYDMLKNNYYLILLLLNSGEDRARTEDLFYLVTFCLFTDFTSIFVIQITSLSKITTIWESKIIFCHTTPKICL